MCESCLLCVQDVYFVSASVERWQQRGVYSKTIRYRCLNSAQAPLRIPGIHCIGITHPQTLRIKSYLNSLCITYIHDAFLRRRWFFQRHRRRQLPRRPPRWECLLLDGNARARYFWYGITALIGVTAILNLRWRLDLRLRYNPSRYYYLRTSFLIRSIRNRLKLSSSVSLSGILT